MLQGNTLAFTGHRPEKLPFTEDSPGGVWLKQAMYDAIMEKVEQGYATFLTGAAMGSDIFFAEQVQKAKVLHPQIRLIACIPFPGQADRWPYAWKQRYEALLQSADSCVMISDHYTRDCFLARDRYMVDHAQALLAAYNGKHEGGTFYTMKYAYEHGRPITILDVVGQQVKFIPSKK